LTRPGAVAPNGMALTPWAPLVSSGWIRSSIRRMGWKESKHVV
jgi:hypothetical protein